MGQSFDRISRVIRAERNARKKDDIAAHYRKEGSALVAGGAVAGASMGSVGILAGGAGYSLGAVPLAGVGALTGAALYEALRSLLEGDSSSAGAAAIGGVAGAATSAAIGGVGVAAGGGAIGMGMASMAAGGAVVGLGLVGLNRLLQQGVHPEKLLDSAIAQMEAERQNAHQLMIDVLACQKRLQKQCEEAQAEVNKWYRRAELALQKDNDYLAREALIQKRIHAKVLDNLQDQLHRAPTLAKRLKQNLTLLETKISEAKMLRTRLKAQMVIIKANTKLQSTGNTLGTSSAMSAFERMEEKVLQMEARAEAAAESVGTHLENYLDILESGSPVDDELAAMKASITGNPTFESILPYYSKTSSVQQSAVDLEALKAQLDNL